MVRMWNFNISVGFLLVIILSNCASIPTQSEGKSIGNEQEISQKECVSIAKNIISKRLFNPELAQFRHSNCTKGTWNLVPSKNLEEVFGWMQQGEVNSTNRKGKYAGFRKYQVLIKNRKVIRYCIYSRKGICTPKVPPDCTHVNDTISFAPVKVVNRFLINLGNGDINSAINLFSCPDLFRYTRNAFRMGELKSISNNLVSGKTNFQVLCGKSMSSLAIVIVNQNVKNGKPSGDPDPLFLVLENKSWRILRYKRIEKEELAYFTPTQKKEYKTLFSWHRNNLRNMLFGGKKKVCDQ